nr:hypothetical protein [uncultured Carboxylicivirga sp.]
MEINSIKELIKFLKHNYYRKDSIQVNSFGQIGQDGFSIEKKENGFDFNYQERGHKNTLKTFQSENDICNYAVQIFEADKALKQHCIAYSKSQNRINRICNRLEKRGIHYVKDSAPCVDNKFIYRIFVFGRDLIKTRFIRL